MIAAALSSIKIGQQTESVQLPKSPLPEAGATNRRSIARRARGPLKPNMTPPKMATGMHGPVRALLPDCSSYLHCWSWPRSESLFSPCYRHQRRRHDQSPPRRRSRKDPVVGLQWIRFSHARPAAPSAVGWTASGSVPDVTCGHVATPLPWNFTAQPKSCSRSNRQVFTTGLSWVPQIPCCGTA